MKTFVIAFLALSFQGTPVGTPVASLVGRWVTTMVPEAGRAPAIAPSFAISTKDGKVFVALEGSPEPVEATVFEARGRGGQDISLLLIHYPATGTATRTVMIRPIAPGQVRFEMYVEYAAGQSQRNWSYGEVFSKSK